MTLDDSGCLLQPHCCKSPPQPIAPTALQILHPLQLQSIVALLQTPATHCTAWQVPANGWREAGWFKCTSTSTNSLIQVQVQKCKSPPIAQHGFQQTGGERLEGKPWLVPRSLCTPPPPPPLRPVICPLTIHALYNEFSKRAFPFTFSPSSHHR